MPARISTKVLKRVSGIDRIRKQIIMVLVDMVVLFLCVWGAYSLRYGILYAPDIADLLLMLAAPIVSIPFFIHFGLYRAIVRYMGEYALWTIVKAVLVSAIFWSAVAFMTSMTRIDGLPRSVPVIYSMLAVIAATSTRFFARWLLRLPIYRAELGSQVLIYGAGVAGRQLAQALRNCQQFFPAGFVDEDTDLIGKDLDGLRVYSPSVVGDIIEKYEIKDVIVTLSSVSNLKRREVVTFLEQFPVKVRILPALAEIANGRHLVNMVREVDIGDLLGRDAVAADPELLKRNITGKVVLVSGAGGSIGSELCRQVAGLKPQKLVLLEANEYALYRVERDVRRMAECEVVPCLGSVGDGALVRRVLEAHGVQTIYHAAAHKHVPLVECNVAEGVRNNVFGTRSIAGAAYEAGVETFVLISTDKAVRPTNVMGATKRWAELVVQEYARMARERESGQRFLAVRFGNVLGSSGSVIPLFKEQIAQGGPVTVTHAEVTRFFMSIHEAVELVIQAGSMADGGEIFLLDMGEPVKIMDLARNMIRLAGHDVRDGANPEGDIDIEVTGLRPGEKLYEELLIADENAAVTDHPKIMKALEPCLHGDGIEALVMRLEGFVADGNDGAVRGVLMDVAEGTTSDLHIHEQTLL